MPMTPRVARMVTCTRTMDTKPGKMVTYSEGLPPIKLRKSLNMWSHEVKWQNT